MMSSHSFVLCPLHLIMKTRKKGPYSLDHRKRPSLWIFLILLTASLFLSLSCSQTNLLNGTKYGRQVYLLNIQAKTLHALKHPIIALVSKMYFVNTYLCMHRFLVYCLFPRSKPTQESDTLFLLDSHGHCIIFLIFFQTWFPPLMS